LSVPKNAGVFGRHLVTISDKLQNIPIKFALIGKMSLQEMLLVPDKKDKNAKTLGNG
jgi:hypothetical protein